MVSWLKEEPMDMRVEETRKIVRKSVRRAMITGVLASLLLSIAGGIPFWIYLAAALNAGNPFSEFLLSGTRLTSIVILQVVFGLCLLLGLGYMWYQLVPELVERHLVDDQHERQEREAHD
jgi:hypothetical protein